MFQQQTTVLGKEAVFRADASFLRAHVLSPMADFPLIAFEPALLKDNARSEQEFVLHYEQWGWENQS